MFFFNKSDAVFDIVGSSGKSPFIKNIITSKAASVKVVDAGKQKAVEDVKQACAKTFEEVRKKMEVRKEVSYIRSRQSLRAVGSGPSTVASAKALPVAPADSAALGNSSG